MDYIYDIEVFPNCFLLCAEDLNEDRKEFEISTWRNDLFYLRAFMQSLAATNSRMVGFNNVAFDYPVLHAILMGGMSDPLEIWKKAQSIIDSEDRFAHLVRPWEMLVPQIDLLKIHHFDNKARMTSLKALEFNMRLDNISDLPFDPGANLTPEQADTLRTYCWNDIEATRAFYERSREQIAFREQLSEKHGKDFLNFSDVKIGKEIFQIALANEGVELFGHAGPKQTLRTSINLADCVPSYVHFNHPEFEKVRQHFLETTITQTKGAFKLVASVSGLDYHFGTGGIHASVENSNFVADSEMMILDVDVTSLYPSLAIENGYYPEHLGSQFVEVYRRLREQRVSYPKGTPENAMLKLALNGVYGASSDPFSVFYDPLFTMKITIAGQVCIAMLAERLATVGEIIQCNTDGITLFLPRVMRGIADDICRTWEKHTRLSLEHVEYARMWIADVNSYLAEKPNGEVKRKGRYDYAPEWHKDHSALVVPKVVEQVLLHDKPIMGTLENWPDRDDFMLRARVNRGSRLVLEFNGQDMPLERTQRYYIATEGGQLVKIMPPLAKAPETPRRIAVQSGWKIVPCNSRLPAEMSPRIDYRWYAAEVDKLVLGVM